MSLEHIIFNIDMMFYIYSYRGICILPNEVRFYDTLIVINIGPECMHDITDGYSIMQLFIYSVCQHAYCMPTIACPST